MEHDSQRITGIRLERFVAKYRLGVPALPRPQTELWDWQLDASCRDLDSAIFFPSAGLRGRELARYERDAKTVCGSCPVVRECRTYAVDAQEPHGIWGGMTTRERAILALPPQRRRVTFIAPVADRAKRGDSRSDREGLA